MRCARSARLLRASARAAHEHREERAAAHKRREGNIHPHLRTRDARVNGELSGLAEPAFRLVDILCAAVGQPVSDVIGSHCGLFPALDDLAVLLTLAASDGNRLFRVGNILRRHRRIAQRRFQCRNLLVQRLRLSAIDR